MCTSPTDAECDAPGANDDASGTAAVLEMARVMAKYEFDATIIFMAVAGEEQGLRRRDLFRGAGASEKKLDIEAMFTNDIVGNTLGGNGVRDRATVRVFSEGVPSSETAEEAGVRRGVGGENDSPSRQLARFVKETGERYVAGDERDDGLQARPLPARRRPHPVSSNAAIAAVRFTEPNEEYRHQHQNVRIENGVQYGDLPEFVDFGLRRAGRARQRRQPGRARARPRPAEKRRHPDGAADQRHGPEVGRERGAGPGRLRDRLARHDLARLDELAAVGNATSYTMKGMSKDNYFFGVRAVDKQGNRSPVSYPKPVR